MFRPAHPRARREKILCMGTFGTGKTLNWIRTAEWHHNTGSPARFYALDTERSFDAFFAPGEEFAHLHHEEGGNVIPFSAYRWTEYQDFLTTAERSITEIDWLVLDSVSPSWEAVQNHYTDEVFDQNKANFFYEARKLSKGGNPLDGWKDWGVINGLYFDWQNRWQELPGHKYLTARPNPIPDNADRGLKAVYGPHGVIPKGQKELGFLPHTVIMLSILRPGEVYATTIKDRQREHMEGKRINQFPLDYLMAIAGWTTAPPESP